jgi:hypothetical protein
MEQYTMYFYILRQLMLPLALKCCIRLLTEIRVSNKFVEMRDVSYIVCMSKYLINATCWKIHI